MSEVLDINEHFKTFGLKEGDIVKENVSVVDEVKDNALICFDVLVRKPHGGNKEE